MKRIGKWSFMGTKIEELKIPRNVEIIEEKAFHKCERLKRVEIEKESQLYMIDDFAFSECSSLTSFQIPPKMREIKRKTFEGNSKLTNITIEEGIWNCAPPSLRTQSGTEHPHVLYNTVSVE